ncbi:hypothetical protein [Aeromonas dhakensis]|uniref:hypothetical protein n=1 Tax=Aeromonas dhakensis TaxID=196024 RepID=UPI00191FA0B2|nr:hypothetical protein [Aeromonas dhakensis]MBL0657304.1 hypothetical protein [Aeromonas dhakensis]
MAEDAMSLKGPYRFVLDSNIIMRLEDYERECFQEGLLSIMLFFDYYKQQSQFKADLIVTPVVFYEFFRLQNVSNLKEYWGKFQSIRGLIERSLGTDVLFDNLDSFEKTEHYINCIEHDSNLIKERLLEIKDSEFDYDFIRSPGGVMGALRQDGMIEVAPILAADHLYKDLNTQYFHPYYVALFLKDHMAHKLSTNSVNNLDVAKEYDNEYLLREVVHLDRKGRVKGLADIELLWKGNIRSQFNSQSRGNYHPVSIPLTVDTNLFLSLKKMSGYGVVGDQIVGGEDPDIMKAKTEILLDDVNRRMTRAKEQQNEFIKSRNEYLKNISSKFEIKINI